MNHEPRIATMADCAAVEAIVRAAYSHYVPRLGREPGPMSDDYSAHIRQGHVHVLDSGEGIQGLLVLIPEETTMLLDNVAVSPAAQGQGFGRKLLEFAGQAARGMGYGTIRLYTNVAMTENIAMYTRIGYRETHRGERKGLHAVYMTKVLE